MKKYKGHADIRVTITMENIEAEDEESANEKFIEVLRDTLMPSGVANEQVRVSFEFDEAVKVQKEITK